MSKPSYKFNNNILEYSLVIQSSLFSYIDDDGNEVENCPPIVSGKRMRIKHKNVDKDMYMTLYGVKFRRRIYDAGLIQAELMIQTEADIDVKTLRGLFMFCPASLAVQGKYIATNYFVNNVSPQYEFSSDNTYSYIYVKLDIVSNDTAFKYSRFSKAHLGEKFISTTVAKMAKALGVSMRELDDSVLQNLAYTYNNESVEYIQPYIVQYNECFYDFMKRIANRCGEAFYFEDGRLCFGLPKDGKTINVAGAKRIVFKHAAHGPYTYDLAPVSDYARDSLKEYRKYEKDSKTYWTYEPEDGKIMTDPIEKSGGYPSDAFTSGKYVYNSEIASEDHYMLLFKGKFARDNSTDLWIGDLDARIVGWISLVLNSTSLLDALSKFAVNEIDAAFKLIKKCDATTDAGNKALKEAAIDSNNDYAVLFSKVDDDKDHWVTLKYYQDIREFEELQSRRMIYVDMGERYCDVKLGDKITIPNNDDVTYVVVDIEMSSGVPWKRSYDDFSDEPAPSGGAQSQRFYAIPIASDGKFYPPVISDKPFRSSGPQPAFIIDAGDFAGQGRVRIRYPWQGSTEDESKAVNDAESAMSSAKSELEKYATVKEAKDGTVTIEKNEDADETKFNTAKTTYMDKRADWVDAKFDLVIAEAASPWIRMAVPMATDGGGMYFQPAKGDEVMVDYENGNIDRPFVVGTLYSKNTPAPSRGKRVIVSPNGHTIKMDDPTDANLSTQSLFPALKFLGNFGVGFKGLEGKAQAALGGIELTDKPGLYSIKMSSHDRQIKIASPLGEVKVDALTGISINAPNGDISIVGKNIDISAYNRLSLTSGRNIKQGGMGSFFSCVADGKAWGAAVAKTGMGLLLKFFDLSLIRTFIEIFVRPIDGTMKIKSFRYVQMEAGQGSTADEPTAYASRPMDRRSKSKAENAKVVSDLIRDVNAKVDLFVIRYVSAFNMMKGASDKFPNALNTTIFGAGKSIETPATKAAFLKDMFENAPADTNDVPNAISTYTADANKFKTINGMPSYLRNRLVGNAKTLMYKTTRLKKLAGDYEHMLDNLGADGKYDGFQMSRLAPPVLTVEPAILGGAPGATHELYTDSIKRVNDFVNHPAVTLFDNNLDAADFEEWKKFIKRRLAHAIIEKCRGNDNPVKDCKFPAAEYGVVRTVDPNGTITTNNTVLVDSNNPFSDADWPNYTRAVKVMEQDSNSFVKGLEEAAGLTIMKKIMPFEWWVWNPESEGRILFSDKKGKTVRFRNGETESYDNPDRLFGEVEQGIKDALNF